MNKRHIRILGVCPLLKSPSEAAMTEEKEAALSKDLSDLGKRFAELRAQDYQLFLQMQFLAETSSKAAARAAGAADRSLVAAKSAYEAVTRALSGEIVAAVKGAVDAATVSAAAATEAAAAAHIASAAAFSAEARLMYTVTCFELSGATATAAREASEAAERAILVAQQAKATLAKKDSPAP